MTLLPNLQNYAILTLSVFTINILSVFQSSIFTIPGQRTFIWRFRCSGIHNTRLCYFTLADVCIVHLHCCSNNVPALTVVAVLNQESCCIYV